VQCWTAPNLSIGYDTRSYRKIFGTFAFEANLEGEDNENSS